MLGSWSLPVKKLHKNASRSRTANRTFGLPEQNKNKDVLYYANEVFNVKTTNYFRTNSFIGYIFIIKTLKYAIHKTT